MLDASPSAGALVRAPAVTVRFVVLGLFLIVAGLALAAVPLTAARFTAWTRFAPYSTDPSMVRYYCAAGAALAFIGTLVAIQLS